MCCRLCTRAASTPISGGAEDNLFLTLRKLVTTLYAFSPLGGGYFSKSVEELRAPPKGASMDEMSVFKDIYVNGVRDPAAGEAGVGLH